MCAEYARKLAWKRTKELEKFEERTPRLQGTLISGQTLILEHLFDQVLMPKSKFIVDSCASMHMMTKVDFTLKEQETITVSRKNITVLTADGLIRAKEQATVHVNDLDMFVAVIADARARLLANIEL